MKNKLFLIAINIILIAVGANAQTIAQRADGFKFNSEADSLRCISNVSSYMMNMNANNYEEAFPAWKKVFDEFPGYSAQAHSRGITLYEWKLQQEKDPAKRDVLIDEMMNVFDTRIELFGNHSAYARYNKNWIIAQKARAYSTQKGDEGDPSLLYKWTGDAINEFKEQTDINSISIYMFASLKLFQSDTDKYKDQYVSDFLKCSDFFDAQLAAAKAANDETLANAITAYKVDIEKYFTGSGAAECDILQSIYAKKIEEHKNDLDFLKQTITLLRRVGCGDSDAFIAASEHAYKIEPSAESAMGLGVKARNNKEYSVAEKYFLDAIEMTDDSEIKASLYITNANLAYELKQYQKAKTFCLNSIREKEQGVAYFIIASVYASVANTVFDDDPILRKCVYYAVIDKLEKARQIDPSLAKDVNSAISAYTQYLPTKEDIFMHPGIKSGETLFIPGIINETVRIK